MKEVLHIKRSKVRSWTDSKGVIETWHDFNCFGVSLLPINKIIRLWRVRLFRLTMDLTAN